MGKTINISQDDLITLKEKMVGINDASHKNFCHDVNEASAEIDEFEIGQESDNPPLGGNYFHVDENLDFEVNSSDIDLSSFKKRDELAPRIWEDEETLNPRIRLKLLDIADDFWEFVNLTWVKPSGIILTGSICNFNWSKFSDIDLHLIVDFDEIDEKTEFVRDYLDAKKNEWNNEHEGLTMLGYPVELYVQNLDEMPKSGGIYDLEENAWLVKPNPHSIRPIGLNKFSIKDKAAKIMTIIDDMYDTFKTTDDSHEIDAIGSDAKYLWQKIKQMRKDSLANEGEWGNGNIVYKCLRREGYLDKLWKLRTLCYDSINSINESVSQTQDIFTLAKERFGTTYDIRECGYVLPDGSMLDFSGRHSVTSDSADLNGRRTANHSDISQLNYERDLKTKSGVQTSMEEFISKGAIRVHASSSYAMINLYNRPTNEQINILLRLIQYGKGNVCVEIGNGNESLSYAEYEDAKPRKVVNEILRYFDEGINLMGNVSESIEKYKNVITLLKEETVADGSSNGNPYNKRWKAEREALKNFICNYGTVMQSKEDNKQGKLYKCFWDKALSQLIGYNYCLCVQWDAINMKPKSVVYIRACDKFTPNIRQNIQYDARGMDNQVGTYDDMNYSNV